MTRYDGRGTLPAMCNPSLPVHPAHKRLGLWLDESIWEETDPARVAARVIAMLRDSGIPLLRVNIAVASLHPELVGFAHIWRRANDKIERLAGDRVFLMSPEIYERSPFHLVDETGVTCVRRRLERSDCVYDFDVLTDMRAEGATDYVVIAIGGSATGDGTFTTWTTDRPGGFTTPELVAIAEHIRMLSHVYAIHSARETARNLVNTYVGRRAGARILAGDIVRGRGTSLEAAIWMSDIRDFTMLSEKLPADDLLALLNAHFDALIGPLHAHGGEVLKLIGDAVLAIFPADGEGGAERACAAALAAAQEARAATDMAGSGTPLRYVVALHLGHVSFGNVGASNRLDFTVIGPAVNFVSRLNGLGKHLDRDIVMSSAFTAHCPQGGATLGAHQLRGLAGTHEAFVPAVTGG